MKKNFVSLSFSSSLSPSPILLISLRRNTSPGRHCRRTPGGVHTPEITSIRQPPPVAISFTRSSLLLFLSFTPPYSKQAHKTIYSMGDTSVLVFIEASLSLPPFTSTQSEKKNSCTYREIDTRIWKHIL